MRTTVAVLCTFVVALGSLSAAPQSLDVSVRGEARMLETQQLRLEGALEGEMRGTLHVTLRWAGGPQLAGDWRLAFEKQQDDGTVVETGALSGAVTDGRTESTPEGAVIALSDLALSVTEGSGEHGGVTGGSGRLHVRFGTQTEPFTAQLSITF